MNVYVDPKTKKQSFLTNAELSAVLGETPRESREREWLSQATVIVPLKHDSEVYSVVVRPVCSFMTMPEKNQYAVFVARGGQCVAEALMDSGGWDNAAFKTQQQAIDAYLKASPKYTENHDVVMKHSYNIFVRQMPK